MDHVLAVGIPEAARRLGVSPRTVVNLIQAKELVSRKIGRRRVIPVSALEAFLRRDHPVPSSCTRRTAEALAAECSATEQ